MEATAFPVLQNDRILRAARGLPVDRVPVWMMRQAGRYLPEFQEVRKKTDFFGVCRTPSLACEVTIQPLRRFDLDAAIIFSDILVVPQALGLEVRMEEKKGPVLPSPIRTLEDMSRLKKFEEIDVKKELGYVMDAITLTRHELKGKVPLIGFSGAPWTLMAYMIEGEGSKTWSKAKSWLFRYPTESHQILHLLTEVIIDYLVAQAQAGAQLLQVFDSWAGELSPDMFKAFSLPYLLRIASEVKRKLRESGFGDELPPMIVFPKGGHFAVEMLSGPESQYDALSLDWTIEPSEARRRAAQAADREIEVNGATVKRSRPITLQGNLDPCTLYGSPEVIRSEVEKMLDSFTSMQGLIANLGHGMLPDHSPEHAGAFVEAVHALSIQKISQQQ